MPMDGLGGKTEIPCVGALGHAVQLGADSGMSPAGAEHLTEILGRCFDAFRRTLRARLRGDACERRVNDGAFKLGARPVDTKARLYSLPRPSPRGYVSAYPLWW